MIRERTVHPAVERLATLQRQRGWFDREIAALLGTTRGTWQHLRLGFDWPGTARVWRIAEVAAQMEQSAGEGNP